MITCWPCIVVATFFVMTAACAPVPPQPSQSRKVWMRDGTSYETFARDQYECQRDAAMLPPIPAPASPSPSPPGMGFDPYSSFGQGARAQQTAYDLQQNAAENAFRQRAWESRCMTSKGYRLVDE